MISFQEHIDYRKIIFAISLLISSNLAIVLNSTTLQNFYSELYIQNDLILFLFKVNSVLFIISMTLVWIMIIVLTHLFANLFDGNGNIKSLFFYSSFGFIFILIGALINSFLFDEMILDIEGAIHSENTLEDVTNIISSNSIYLKSKFVGNLSQFLVFVWIAYIIKHVYRINYFKSILASFYTLGLLYIINHLAA